MRPRAPKKRWCETCGEQPEAFVEYRLCKRCLRVAVRVWIAVVSSGVLRKAARR
jgi:hypothetical protein